MLSALLCGAAPADTLRVMSYNPEISRKGPGLLARDIMRGKDKQIIAALERIVALKPDIVALQSIDFDYDHVVAGLLKEALSNAGHAMPHHFTRAPNTGLPTGFDIDRNGRLAEARDRQGYGLYTGQDGMLLLSRFPIAEDQAKDFTAELWADAADTRMPMDYFTPQEAEVLRLHSVGAWDVPVETPYGRLHVLVSQAGPPVFDGPEDRNGLRNADEIGFWTRYIARKTAPFVLLAGLNNDPVDGEGLKPAIRNLLGSDAVIDPAPEHSAGTDTVDWKFDNLRVDYVLPSARFGIGASGIDWPAGEGEGDGPSRHKPVWVDIVWQ